MLIHAFYFPVLHGGLMDRYIVDRQHHFHLLASAILCILLTSETKYSQAQGVQRRWKRRDLSIHVEYVRV